MLPFFQNPPAESRPAYPTYAPASTPVAILPVMNLSGEKDRKQRTDQALKGDEELRKQFESRGFPVLDAATVQKALDELEIDLTDEENHNRATLYKIGEKLGTRLLAFAVITDVEQRRIFRGATDDTELVAMAKVKVWLLDVPSRRHLLSGYRQEAQSKNPNFASFDSGARHIRKSVEGAVRDSLKSFFATVQRNGR